MKKFCYLFSVLSLVLLLAACGSSKQVGVASAGNPEGRVAIAKTDAQLYAEEKPEVRSWGQGKHHRLNKAIESAELAARSAMARAIASAIISASKESDISYEKFSASADGGSTVTDEANMGNSLASSIANETVRDAIRVKTDQFMTANGQYEVFVCMEYRHGLSAVAKQVAKKVESLIPEDERLKIKYDAQQFENSVMSQLEKTGMLP